MSHSLNHCRKEQPIRALLDELYLSYNRPEYIHPDPLEFLHRYESGADREVVGLIASVLAYGRVGQILKSVETILESLGPSPSVFLRETAPVGFQTRFKAFKHRFTTGEQIGVLLGGMRRLILSCGSLEACFLEGYKPSDPNVLPALGGFVAQLNKACGRELAFLLPLPSQGSACKRLNLFLRWMVRCDGVDPGDWKRIPASKLVVPLDTHMHRIGRNMRFTARKQADLKAALEITQAFKKICPEDPVRYDFALTRIGMMSVPFDEKNLAGPFLSGQDGIK